MTTLRNTISELASTFAAGVLNAIRGASLEEILAESGGAPRRGPGRPSASAGSGASSGGGRGRGGKGRLGRRSASDIAGIVDSIVGLLGRKPKGLRAEEIRRELGLQAKELPRPIAEALAGRKITKQGQKRATTYFARGAAKAAAPKRRSKPRAAKGATGSKNTKKSAKKSRAASTRGASHHETSTYGGNGAGTAEA